MYSAISELFKDGYQPHHPLRLQIIPFSIRRTFDTLVKQTKADIEKLTDNEDKKKATAELKSLQSQENNLTLVIAALANTLTNVQKDFLTYYQNIYLAKDTLPTPKLDKNGNPLPMPIGVSMIRRLPNPRIRQSHIKGCLADRWFFL